ncbi:MAG: hypothetical protein CMJ64_12370 [Planctomycetaceae bacterium]|jgi:hypothetical protein|nr:hypothetical protein [Planctomycetaceae bacterium]
MDKVEQRKKPQWQFRLRSLLFVMLLVAAYFAGWSAAMSRVAHVEVELKKQMEKALKAEQQARMQALRQVSLAERNAAIASRQLQKSRMEVIRSDATFKTMTERVVEVVRKLPPESIDSAEASKPVPDTRVY